MKTPRAHDAVKAEARGVVAAGSLDTTTPARFAHVWTTERGILTVRVETFPLAFGIGAWVYEAVRDGAGRPLVRHARRTGAETVEYRRRRPIRADEWPRPDEPHLVALKDPDGY